MIELRWFKKDTPSSISRLQSRHKFTNGEWSAWSDVPRVVEELENDDKIKR